MRISREQAKVATEWWTNILKNPKFQTLSNKERSNIGSQPAAMAEFMASAFHKCPSIDKQNAFRQEMERYLLNTDIPSWGIGVDYHPDIHLAAVAQAIGLVDNGMIFPWKTQMHFDDGGVQVSYGYGAELETLL